MKKITAVIICLGLLFSFSITASATQLIREPKAMIDAGIKAEASIDFSNAVFHAKDETYTTIEYESFGGGFKSNFDELTKYKSDCNDLWDQIKESDSKIKDNWNLYKVKFATNLTTFKNIKPKFDALRLKIKAVNSEIYKLRQKKLVEWKKMSTAVKALKKDPIKPALSNVLNYKKQIISKQKILLDYKGQMINMFKTN